MDTPVATDEGEPAKPINKFCCLVCFFAIPALMVVSCNQPERKPVMKPAVTDSSSGKMQKQQRIDSSVKKTGPAVTKKKIYLTFDDGPNKGTMNVLNAVKEDSIPASFFIVGKHTNESPGQKETWEQLKADSAIELCNHSYTHALNHYTKYYEHPEEVVKDIERNKEQLGFDNAIVRMPGRNAWRIDSINHTDIRESKAAIDSVHTAGFAIMGWDVEWMFDHKTLKLDTDTDLLLRRIQNMLDAGKTKTKDNLVLLAHDQAFQSEAAVEQLHYLFRELKTNPEYELVLAGNYPGIKNIIKKKL
jgi:peptidoglycan/xylan/chitin deacetylase (PgdA/CDA1 family)